MLHMTLFVHCNFYILQLNVLYSFNLFTSRKKKSTHNIPFIIRNCNWLYLCESPSVNTIEGKKATENQPISIRFFLFLLFNYSLSLLGTVKYLFWLQVPRIFVYYAKIIQIKCKNWLKELCNEFEDCDWLLDSC